MPGRDAGMLGHSGAMRGRLLLSTVGVMVAAVVISWASLVSRSEPAEPELGPAVQVRLSPTAVAPSRPLSSATGGPSGTTPPAASDTPTTAPTARVIPPTATPSGGAQTVPRQSPLPAGDDDDDDHDDGDDDDDGDDGDDPDDDED